MTSTDTPTVMMDKLAEAAWAQLADMPPQALHIDEVAAARIGERGGRADDKRSESAMEDRKKEGYF